MSENDYGSSKIGGKLCILLREWICKLFKFARKNK